MVIQKSNLLNKYIIFFFLIFLFGVLLRVYNLNFEDYWFDEQAGFWVADPSISLSETLERSKELDRGTHLVFNLILKTFFYVLGYDPSIGRILPLIFGVLSIPALSYLSFQINNNKSFLLTAIISSINFYLISYSQETRLYSLVFFVSILNIIFFFKIYDLKDLNKSKFLFSILYILFTVLGTCLHIFFFIIIFSQIIFLLVNYIFKKRTILFEIFIIFISICIYLFFMFDSLLLQMGIKEFWIQQVSLEFFYNFFFSRFFGSKIMGLIYLIILLYLIYSNRVSVFKYNSKFLLLIFILFFSYFIPLVYSIFQKPILIDRYIIFILVPIIILISNLLLNENNTKKRYIILFIILSSTITNNYIEIFEREISKPEFSKSLINISNFEDKSVIIKAGDELTEKLTINYVKNIKISKDNNINFLKSSDDLSNLGKLWFVCYQPINGFDCSAKNYIFSSWEILSETNHKLLTTYQFENN